jgi:c-di-GMP-binding flagellar brake protein YcgR
VSHQRKESSRISIPLHVKFKSSKEATEYTTGITNNISHNGLCFETEALELRPRETVKLMIKMPKQDRFYNMLGEFVWKKQGKNKCRIGLRIKEMDKEIASEILDYAANIWNDVGKRAKIK